MSTVLKVVGASWLRTKISSYILGILGILAILALFVGQIERMQEDGNYAATVFYSEKTGYRIEYWGQSNELATIPAGVARAYFRTDVDTSGWAQLEVETNPNYPDAIQAYAAGVVEGALTWYLIHTHLENTIREKCDDTPLQKQCNKLKDSLDQSVNTWKTYADEHASKDPFWHQVSLYYSQMNGIITGWQHGVEKSTNEYETDLSDIYWLNSIAEVAELQHTLNISIENTTLDKLPALSSAFLRIVNETDDRGMPTQRMFLAQNAVGNYSSMTRILKRYKLNFHHTSESSELIPGTSVDFSGYPGAITSQDEFYLVRGQQHRMAITGTALRNYNEKLWKDVDIIEQIPLGPRVLAANHLATNVSSWAHILATSNSGTASKQWLVVDFNRFQHPHEAPEAGFMKNEVFTESDDHVRHTVVHHASTGRTKGLVALVEQVPGRTHSADLSDKVLDQGYWATHGLPFFKDIAETTHIKQMEEQHGQIFSESDSPRAVLFKHGYKNATSLDSILKLMRQNNVTAMNRASNQTNCSSDIECVISERGYWSVLGVRGDIANHHKEAYGVIDTKIVSGTRKSSSIEFVAFAGPPYTEIQPNRTTPINKGNLAPIYTQFNEKSDIGGIEIRDLIKQQEETEEKELQLLNKDKVKPFDWSISPFVNISHVKLPDRWAFDVFKPHWSW